MGQFDPITGYDPPDNLYPKGPNATTPPPLTPDLFDQCHQSLQTSCQGDSWAKAVNRWYSYATDGDITRLPVPDSGNPATPWDYLTRTCTNPMQQHVSHLQSDHAQLVDAWHGAASTNYLGYLQSVRDQLAFFVGNGPDATPGSWLAQAGALLQAAHAVQIGFKKDLYEMGYAACRAGWGQNNSGLLYGNDRTFGMLLLGVAGLALGGAGAIAIAGQISARVFVGGVLTMAGSYVFQTVPDNTTISGPGSFNDAMDTLVAKYQNSVEDVTTRMGSLIGELTSAAQKMPQPPQVQVVTHVAPELSLRFSNFNPA